MSGFLWLASYPKSGNTWLRLVLGSLSRQSTTIDINEVGREIPIVSQRDTIDEALGTESSDFSEDEIERLRPCLYRQMAQSLHQPAWRKVHDAWTLTDRQEPLFPADISHGAIVIVRDPRDVAVSLASHTGRSVDDTIAFMADANACLADGRGHSLPDQIRQRLLDWSGHVASWLDTSGLPILCLRYEDVLAQPQTSFHAAMRFAGLERSDEDLAALVEAARFDALRGQEERFGFGERNSPSNYFFRRGIAGGWRDTLSPEQVRRIETAHGPMMSRLGYL